MKIVTADGKPIRSLSDWSTVHDPKHWVRGRSAYSVADFILNRNGARRLSQRVSEVLGESVTFHKITPEHKVKFDQYRNPRVHDLGIYGETESGKSLFVGVEAKVDESFGPYVADEWRKARRIVQQGRRTRLPDRISELCDRFQDGPGISPTDEIRYQLMHGAAGTVEAGADVSVLYIAVFVTDDYDEAKGIANFQDCRTFLNRAGATINPNQNRDRAYESHTLNMSGKALTTIYEYIDLRR